ncbi:hypothetical protein MHYP_G00201960 [Metynnis hypsauchen]
MKAASVQEDAVDEIRRVLLSAPPEAFPETPAHFITRDECCTDDHKPPDKMASDLTAVPDTLERTVQLEALEVRHQSSEWTTANIPR